jgi:hypothetical protein
MSAASRTTNHDIIRKWAQERGGQPATVRGTGEDEPGILRLDFEPRDEDLEPISWDAFFEKFDEADLAFLYQEETEGGAKSRFHKFVSRKDN